MRLKLKNIWAILVFLICLSVTEIGKKLVKNLMFLSKVIFNQEIPIEWIYLSYKCLLCGFLIVSIIMVLSFCQKKHKQKNNSTKVEMEFERIMKNPNLRNIWVLGPWGSGKTKFVKSSLDKLGKKYFYISLFGLNTRNDIIQEINEQITSETKLSLIVELPIIGLFFKWLFQINGLSILRSFSDKWIIVLDDFERVFNGFRGEIINSKENLESEERMSKIELDSYNDVLGVIDYLQQSFGCKVIVISSKETIDELFDKIIIPKFHPYQYHIDFNLKLIKDFPKAFFKKDKPEEIQIFSKIFSIVWHERIKLKEITNYRPIIYELSLLSDETDNRYKISYILSRLIDDWEIEMVPRRLIPFEFLVNREKEGGDLDNSKYTLIEKIFKINMFENGFPYYVPKNSRGHFLKLQGSQGVDKIQEALVYSYMKIDADTRRIPDDYAFNIKEIMLLTSQKPTTLLQGREIRMWVSENYIQHHYSEPGMIYKHILTTKYQNEWKDIYQTAAANYFVRDIGLDTNSKIADSIVMILKKFEFLILDVKTLKKVIDIDYVKQVLLVENSEGTHVDSRILYRFLSEIEEVSGKMSLYLISNSFEHNGTISLNIGNDDLFIPVLDERPSIIETFIASEQYKFEKLLWNLKENSYAKKHYVDKKEFDGSNIFIYKEHAFFIVEFMETDDTINGDSTIMYIKKFIGNNASTEKKDLLNFVYNLRFKCSDEENTRTCPLLDAQVYDEEMISSEPVYEPIHEPLVKRYDRWLSIIQEM